MCLGNEAYKEIKMVDASKLQTNIQVVVTGHAGFLSPEIKAEYSKAYRRTVRSLEIDGYIPCTLHPDLFIKGKRSFARIHSINDWKMTSEDYSEPRPHPSREGYYIRDLIRKGYRFHTAGVHISRWTL